MAEECSNRNRERKGEGRRILIMTVIIIPQGRVNWDPLGWRFWVFWFTDWWRAKGEKERSTRILTAAASHGKWMR